MYNIIGMKDSSKIDLIDSDNWLQKERIRESKISAWDFDDGSKLRNEHADNCDVKDVAKEHIRVHEGNMPTTMNRRVNSIGNTNNNFAKWLVVDIIAMFGYAFLFFIEDRLYFDGFSIVNTVWIFYGLLFGFIFYGIFKKRLPSATYLRNLFIMTIILEIIYIVTIIMENGFYF